MREAELLPGLCRIIPVSYGQSTGPPSRRSPPGNCECSFEGGQGRGRGALEYTGFAADLPPSPSLVTGAKHLSYGQGAGWGSASVDG